MKHLLKLDGMPGKAMEEILASTEAIKTKRGGGEAKPLDGQTWAMIFTKSSTRTRVSFEVGIRELGGSVMFLNGNDMQLGRGEPIKDTARVLGRMVHGAVIRTYAQRDVEEFAEYSSIPTINALTDAEHPCQILTDIFTFQERRGSIRGNVVAYVGDGACNVPLSWVHAATALDFELRIAAPAEFHPSEETLAKAGANISCTEDIQTAVNQADLVYTDVWVSMGMEAEAEARLAKLSGYQINGKLMRLAKPDALVMHCLPAYRGREIDEETFFHVGILDPLREQWS
ncbi:MAG: ornithine carbamoyltransferase [Actinomycetota bacterium]|nr:ornithine carbamoyltransferase [Actinomycetota bacterium]